MTETQSQPTENADIVAHAGRYYRNARFIIVAGCLIFGAWCAYDGFVKWPAENAKAAAAKQNLPHPGFDVPMNQGLALLLPPLGAILLAWTLYNSRGEYRLSGNTLHVPGHPPVSLDNMRKIDKRLWDRKGIAWIEYETADNQRSRLKLDDFVYQREPTDRILERIESHALSLDAPPPPQQPA